MKRCAPMAIAALLVPLAASFASAQQDRGSIAGQWTLSRDLSDDPQQVRPTEARRGGSGGAPTGRAGGGRGGGRGGGFVGTPEINDGSAALDPQYMRQMQAMLQEVLDEPGHLAIAVTDRDVAFTDAEGHVERFKTDNSKEKHQLKSGTVDTRVKWDRGRLVKETSLLGLATVKQAYSVDPAGNLHVDLRVDRVRVPEPFLFKLVYVRDRQ